MCRKEESTMNQNYSSNKVINRWERSSANENVREERRSDNVPNTIFHLNGGIVGARAMSNGVANSLKVEKINQFNGNWLKVEKINRRNGRT